MDPASLLVCLVVGITDGDTLQARCADQTLKVRLAEIDAPERGQAYGTRSRQHLAELCFGKPAELRAQATDRYGRTVARVACDGVDSSAEQVRAGMAWVFDRYATDRSLYALQDAARNARRGVWANAEPVPPWQWRRQGARSSPAATE